MHRRIVLALAAGLLGCTACASVIGIEPFTDDAATKDAALGPDVPTTADGGNCPAVLCDGFESAKLASFWIPNTTVPDASAGGSLGTVEIDSIHVHSGARALHVHVDAIPGGNTTTGYAFITESESLESTPDQAYVRAWFYLPALSDAYQIMAYQSPEVSEGDLFLSFGPNGNTQSATLGLNPLNMKALTVATDLPLSTWFCLEWQADFASPQQSLLYLNDAQIMGYDYAQPTEVNGQSWMYFNLGLQRYYPTQADSAIDMWIDDVVIDTSLIPCSGE